MLVVPLPGHGAAKVYPLAQITSAELRHSPDTVLGDYDLTDAEQAAVRLALDRLGSAPARQALEFRNALLRRVAT